MNSVVLVGRAGADPEIKYFESGRMRSTFNLAVDRPVKRTEGQDTTDWFRIEIWGKDAERAKEWIRKGSLLGIQGRLEISKWTDKNGQKQEMFIISASTFRLLGSRQDSGSQAYAGAASGGGDSDFAF
ncbi:MAG: single-stranded DNA-binding protein [bacterium]|jgi:single-strand DNA-binding protein|nr:single-stranded DNA-binding protein [bacterium]